MTQAISTGFLDANDTVSYSKLGPKDIDTKQHQELARPAAGTALALVNRTKT